MSSETHQTHSTSLLLELTLVQEREDEDTLSKPGVLSHVEVAFSLFGQ